MRNLPRTPEISRVISRDLLQVIIDAQHYVRNLPHSLEAILGDAETHRKFLQFYNLTSEQVPLLYNF